jgi:hypothetical protein
VDWVNISGQVFFLPGQKLIGEQRFNHKYSKKKNNNDKKPLLFKNYF